MNPLGLIGILLQMLTRDIRSQSYGASQLIRDIIVLAVLVWLIYRHL